MKRTTYIVIFLLVFLATLVEQKSLGQGYPLINNAVPISLDIFYHDDTLNKGSVYMQRRQAYLINNRGTATGIDSSSDSCLFIEFVSTKAVNMKSSGWFFGKSFKIEFLDENGDLIYAFNTSSGDFKVEYSQKYGGWYFYHFPVKEVPYLVFHHAKAARIIDL